MGDILVQIMFHSDIASRVGEFDVHDVLDSINQKLIRRHPHVFGDVKITDAREVERNWDLLKQQEGKRKSPVDGIPTALPSLAQAQLMQDRAARSGFDWEDVAGVMEKILEEIKEVEEARNLVDKEEEIGDLLFSLVNLARWQGIHAEDALRRANDKFRNRYLGMEKLANERGIGFDELPLDAKEKLWEEVKGICKEAGE